MAIAPFQFPWFPHRHRLIALGLIFLLGLSLLGSCQRSPDGVAPPPKNGDRITIGTILTPRTLDPADSYDLLGLMVSYNVCDPLYTYKPGTTELIPNLATEFPDISADGLTYRIPVRQGVKFQDGTFFNAEAMTFSLNRFIQNGGKPAFLLADTVANIAATHSYEVTITLKKPFAAFPALLAFPGACAVSPQVYEIGANKFIPDRLVGTGRYQIAAFSSDSLKLDVFDGYWGAKPKNKGIDLQIYPANPANLYNAFRTGAVDVAYQSLEAAQSRQLKADTEDQQWKVIETTGTAIHFLTLNLNLEPTTAQGVRRAIAALIDRQLLNDRILRGQGEPLFSLIPSAFASSLPVFQTRYGDHNIAQAKAYLAEVGITPENPVSVEVWHSSGSITTSIVAAVLKALAKRDLDNAIRFEPNSIAAAAFFKNIGRGLYTTALSNWYPDFLDADNYLSPFLACAKGSPEKGCEEGGAQSQGSFYFSDRMNQLIDRQRQESDPSRRQAILAEIQEILAEDVPYIPLWQSKESAFVRRGIRGVIINPSQTLPFWTIQPRPSPRIGTA
jgi:peptide/nickel transport system substrate-binding protein